MGTGGLSAKSLGMLKTSGVPVLVHGGGHPRAGIWNPAFQAMPFRFEQLSMRPDGGRSKMLTLSGNSTHEILGTGRSKNPSEQ